METGKRKHPAVRLPGETSYWVKGGTLPFCRLWCLGCKLMSKCQKQALIQDRKKVSFR